MKKQYLIGVDLGTSGTKAAIFRKDGELIAEDSLEVDIYYPSPGVVEQENEDFYTSAAKTIKTCIHESGIDPAGVAGIAFVSQMAGVGMIDENYQPVGRFDSWLDMRCRPYIRAMAEEAGDEITRLTGCASTCNHGPKILWWKNEHPDVYDSVAKFIMPAGYVAGRLCGLKADQAFIDYTFIHFSGFSNALEGTWSDVLCNRFDMDMGKLPEIVEPWRVVGEVTEEGAKDLGLVPGIVVAAGAGDTASNALGAGIVRPGMLFDVAGTAAVLAGCTNKYVTDIENRALLTMRSVIPGLWNPLAYIAGGGIALRWIRDEIYHRSLNREASKDDLYDEIMTLAEKVMPGADGLFFSPHLGGRICPSSPKMRGAWVGLSWSHKQAHLIRAVLESVAFEYAYYLKILRGLLPELSLIETRAMGGGAKSRAWNQIKADVLGVPYYRLMADELGTWGAAMIAGKAAGLIDNLADHAEKCAKIAGEPSFPDRERHQAYQPMIDKYIGMELLLEQFFSEYK